MVKKHVKEAELAQQPVKNALPDGFSSQQVGDAVKVLLQNVENVSSKKKFLFAEDGEFIRIQVACVRIPKCYSRNYRFNLPHGYLKDTSEVCLFVRNLSGNKSREYEDTVQHFKNLLSEADVKSVHEVISINQLKQEYKSYEMKRRLAARFDFILADASVNNWVHGCLGKQFHRCKKLPTPVRLHSNDLKGAIDKALHKTMMTVTGNGDNFMAKVGNTKQSVEQICENIEAFVKQLKESFPGKWGNVRSLHLRTDHTVAIPIYYAIVIPNSVKIPKVKPRPGTKNIPVVEGDLSTLPDGYSVVVMPDGRVKVKKVKGNGEEVTNLEDLPDFDGEDDSEMDEEEEDIMSDSKEEEVVVKEAENVVTDSEVEEEEGGVEAAEEAYLKELSMGRTESKKRKIKEEPVPPVKKTKKRKMKEEQPVSSVETARKSARGKGVPISTQWNVEELGKVTIKQKNDKKSSMKSKKVNKSSNTLETTVPEPMVKAKVQLGKKVAKKTNQVTVSGAVSNGEVRKSKSGKAKKKSDA